MALQMQTTVFSFYYIGINMRILLLSLIFLAPLTGFAGSFLFEAEGDRVTLFVVPEEEVVYTAKAALLFDERLLTFSDLSFAEGVMPLLHGTYDEDASGRIVKTGGFPNGITEKAPLLSFSLALKGDVGTVAIERTSFLLDREGNRIPAEFDTFVLGALQQTELPEALNEPLSEESAIDLPETIDLPAAVIAFDEEFPFMPVFIGLLILALIVIAYGVYASRKRLAKGGRR